MSQKEINDAYSRKSVSPPWVKKETGKEADVSADIIREARSGDTKQEKTNGRKAN